MVKPGTKFNRNKNPFSLIVVAGFVLAQLSIGTECVYASQKSLIDRIVAVVDAEPILMSEINKKVKDGPLVQVSDFPADGQDSTFQQALNDAINFRLLKIAAADLMIEISEDEVDTQIDKILKDQKATRSQLYAFLKEQGKTFSQYREDFGNQLLIRKFQGRVVLPLVKVSDAQVRAYYLEKTGRRAENATLDLRLITIPVGKSASKNISNAKLQIAEEAYEKIINGMNFEQVANLYAPGGGTQLLTGVEVEGLAPHVRKAVQSLDVGGTSRPTKTEQGINIFHVVGKSLKANSNFFKMQRQIEYEIRNLEAAKQLDLWLEVERQRRKVTILD